MTDKLIERIKVDRGAAKDWANKVAKSKPPRYTDASRNAAAVILADDEVMKAVGEWVAARGFGDTCDKAAWDRLAKAEAALSAAYRAAVEEQL